MCFYHCFMCLMLLDKACNMVSHCDSVYCIFKLCFVLAVTANNLLHFAVCF
jgi:hypothetical protein